MWIYCDCDSNTEIKFCIDSDFFSVKSVIKDKLKGCEPKLFACFLSDDNFLIGNYTFYNNENVLDKKYSISYLKSQGIDIKNLSHFVINSSNGNLAGYYPAVQSVSDDPAVKRAKSILESIKSENKINNIDILLECIKNKAKKYNIVSMPFMIDYTWHKVDNFTEDFGLSAVSHLMISQYFKDYGKSWFFGFSPENRIYAVAVKGDTPNKNPLCNADDCTCVYANENNSEFYFVVGIILLDDGQYFCALD